LDQAAAEHSAVAGTAEAEVPTAFIVDALTNARGDESGWIHLGAFGQYLTKLRSDFDPRLYGFKKLSDLIRAMERDVEVVERGSSDSTTKPLYIRLRKGTVTKRSREATASHNTGRQAGVTRPKKITKPRKGVA
jgi:hypothetical protein